MRRLRDICLKEADLFAIGEEGEPEETKGYQRANFPSLSILSEHPPFVAVELHIALPNLLLCLSSCYNPSEARHDG